MPLPTISHIEEVLNGYQEIRDWYNTIGQDYTGLHELLMKSDQLAVWGSTLSVIVAQAHSDYLENKHEYESTLVNRKLSLKPVAKAEASVYGRKKTSVESHKLYVRLKGHLDGIKPILDRMNQRISQLRSEWKNDSFIKAFEDHVNELQERINNLENHGNQPT